MAFFKIKFRAQFIALVCAFSLAACGTDDSSDDGNNQPEDSYEERDSTGRPDAGRPDVAQPDADQQEDVTPDEPDTIEDVADETDTETPDTSDPDASFSDVDPSSDAATQDTTEPGQDTTDEDVADDDTGEEDALDEDIDEEDTLEEEPSGNTCEEAFDATAGGEWEADTRDADDNYDSPISARNCPAGAYSGNDQVYRLSPQVDTTYKIVMTPRDSSFDPLLYVVEDCTTPIAACVDGTKFNGPGVHETISSLPVPAGATYFVIADGETGSSGPYTMNISIVAQGD